jgi:Peptidase M50B-like
MVSTLADVWDRLVVPQPAPPSWLVLACAVLALAAVLPRRVWPITRNFVTIAHEAGHAVIALMAGRRLAGVRLHSDTSGVTVSVGKPTGFGMVATAAAGYPAPSLLGLGGAGLLTTGHITALLWLSLALLAGMLVMIRNLFGAVSLVATGSVVFAVSWFASAQVQAGFAYLLTWFLLLAGPRPVVELQRKRRRGAARYSDADQLASLTGVPSLVWVAFFAVLTVAALLAGAYWLVESF